MIKRVREGNSDINEPAAKVIKIDDSTSLQNFLGDLLFGKIGKGWHPLDFATWVKNQAAQDYFINQGYCAREERSGLSIHNAVIYGDIKRVTDFLSVDPSSIESYVFGHKPLTAAIAMGNKDMVNCLLDNRADIEGTAGENKYTPLATAISIDDIDMVALLLDKGADIDGEVSPNSECAPLLMALGFRHKNWCVVEEALAATPNIELAKLLIERDADVDALRGFHSAIAQASCRNLPEIIEVLLTKGASFLLIDDHNIVNLLGNLKRMIPYSGL